MLPKLIAIERRLMRSMPFKRMTGSVGFDDSNRQNDFRTLFNDIVNFTCDSLRDSNVMVIVMTNGDDKNQSKGSFELIAKEAGYEQFLSNSMFKVVDMAVVLQAILLMMGTVYILNQCQDHV